MGKESCEHADVELRAMVSQVLLLLTTDTLTFERSIRSL